MEVAAAEEECGWIDVFVADSMLVAEDARSEDSSAKAAGSDFEDVIGIIPSIPTATFPASALKR